MEILNKKFGRLTVTRHVERTLYECACVCGCVTVLPRHRLLRGNTKSCGCLKRSVLGDAKRTHGLANSRITGYASRAYGVWQAMRDRCTNKNRADYHRYGGRGIKVCKRWESFTNFLEDMGHPPERKTLDRIDNDKGYCKRNCRWATRKEQVYNSTRIRIVTIKGKSKPLQKWLSIAGIARDTFYRRLRNGETEKNALFKHK